MATGLLGHILPGGVVAAEDAEDDKSQEHCVAGADHPEDARRDLGVVVETAGRREEAPDDIKQTDRQCAADEHEEDRQDHGDVPSRSGVIRDEDRRPKPADTQAPRLPQL